MKKSILFFIFFSFVFTIKSNAQYPPNWLATGTPSTATLVGGTTSLKPILFITDNLQTGWMDETNQYTGIGTGWGTTNRPQYQLDILENGGNLFRTIGNGNFNCDWESWIQSGINPPAMYGRVYVPANTTDFAMEASKGSLEFNTGGANERMCITSKGNVIIYNSVVLKASDGNTYYRLTVNSKGELKITKVDEQTI